jgi:hypothetical protein
LSLARLSVYTIALAQKVSDNCLGTGYDVVDSLKIIRSGTIVSIHQATDGGDVLLSGSVAEGTADQPGVILGGNFYWVDHDLVKIEHFHMQMRLTNVSVVTPVLGGRLSIPKETPVFIEGESLSLSKESSSGTLLVRIPAGTVIGVKIRWADIDGSSNFQGKQLLLEEQLSADRLQLGAGEFIAKEWTSNVPNEAITQFVKDHVVEPAAIQFAGLQLSVADGSATIHASKAIISNPGVSYLPRPDLKVMEASELWLENPKSSNCQTSSTIILCGSPESSAVSLQPNQLGIVERLNRFGFIEPDDYLLPTGAVGIKYITVSALHEIFYTKPTPTAISKKSAPSSSPSAGSQDGVPIGQAERDLLQDLHDRGTELIMNSLPTTVIGEEIAGFTKILAKMLLGSDVSVATATSIFVSSSLYRNGTTLGPWFAEKAFVAAHSVMRAVPELAGAKADDYAEEQSGELRKDRKRVVWAVLMGGCQSYVST